MIHPLVHFCVKYSAYEYLCFNKQFGVGIILSEITFIHSVARACRALHVSNTVKLLCFQPNGCRKDDTNWFSLSTALIFGGVYQWSAGQTPQPATVMTKSVYIKSQAASGFSRAQQQFTAETVWTKQRLVLGPCFTWGKAGHGRTNAEKPSK